MMKTNRIVVLSLVLAGVALNGYSAVVSNLLTDASFEALVPVEPNADTVPWFTVGEETTFKVQASPTYAVTGLQSVKISNNDAASVVQLVGTVESNMAYEASAWMRTSTPVGSHPDAPKLSITIWTSPTTNGVFAYRKTIMGAVVNSAVDTWERFSGSLGAAALSEWEGEYIQVRFNKNDNGTTHWLYIDDVEFGEYSPDPAPEAPEGMLIGWYGSATNDYLATGIGGTILTNNMHFIDNNSGSSDGTYGTIGGSGTGAVTTATGYDIRVGPDALNPLLTLRFAITNNTAEALQLDSISFDYGRFFVNGPADIALLYDTGDLAGVTNDTPINSALATPITGKYGDYNDYDWVLSGLADTILAPGEAAQFKFIGSTTGDDFASGAFDNIGIFGGVPTASYANWAAGWGVPLGTETEDYDYDGLLNLYEYGLGGDPTNGFVDGEIPTFGQAGSGLEYVHAQRTDDLTLSYYLELSDDLVSPNWTNSGYTVVATNVTGGIFDYVTNSIPTVDAKKFLRLIIEN